IERHRLRPRPLVAVDLHPRVRVGPTGPRMLGVDGIVDVDGEKAAAEPALAGPRKIDVAFRAPVEERPAGLDEAEDRVVVAVEDRWVRRPCARHGGFLPFGRAGSLWTGLRPGSAWSRNRRARCLPARATRQMRQPNSQRSLISQRSPIL